MKTPYMCSGRRYGSTDMPHDLFPISSWLWPWSWPRSNFQHDLLMSNYSSFECLDKRNTMLAGKMSVVPYWVKSYYRKTFFFSKMIIFCSFCCLEPNPLIVDQIWGHASERALKELSNALSRGAVALLVPELCASLSNNVEIGQIWLLMTSGNLIFDLT